jgi:serine/threonine protein kinase
VPAYYVPPEDETLTTLAGVSVASDLQPGVSYRLGRTVGGGGMSVAFSAVRMEGDAQLDVVLKILRPSLAREAPVLSALFIQKEAVALGRLNERVPPTRFVVRLLDAGTIVAHDGTRRLELSWLALESVVGGALGTTLEDRVRNAITHGGSAFDPERASNALLCLAAGLVAIHDVGVVHRDLKPGNVLCCGSGAEEIFKIADFGIARPEGMAGTFAGVPMGTPGYAAPEQFNGDAQRIGPWTDVFALATVVFELLTNDDYFPADSPGESLVLVQRPERRSLAASRFLCPELRERPALCATLDAALARATASNPDHRPQSADVLVAMLLPSLRAATPARTSATRRPKGLAIRTGTLADTSATSRVRRQGGGAGVIRSVAWASDLTCLCATSEGIGYWSGTSFQLAPPAGLPAPEEIHFVRRMGADAWLLGGEGATVFRYAADGLSPVLVGGDPRVRLVLASGDVEDVAVVVGVCPGEPPALLGVAAGHWLKPAALPRAASITSLAQLGPTRWLVTGRASSGEGFAVLYEPLMWEVKRLKTPAVRVYLASATRPELGLGIIGGTGGQIVHFKGDTTTPVELGGDRDVSAVALDAEGRAWAATIGRLWTADPDAPTVWRCVYKDDAPSAPVISLYADIGGVVAMTADGGVVEVRLDPRAS